MPKKDRQHQPETESENEPQTPGESQATPESPRTHAESQPEPVAGTESRNESHNSVHVETHTESHAVSGSFNPAADVAELTADAQDRIAELTADLQRVQAEFQNFRRRSEADRADSLALAKNHVVREFLTVRDSFDNEQAHRPAKFDANWAKSIDAIRAQFDQVLSSLGVERFESKGQPFDPHLHEAIAMDDGEGDHEIVTEELQPGYKLGDSILRHAIVKVGRTSKP